RLRHRQLDNTVHCAIGRVAHYPAAGIFAVPQTPVGIDGRAVRTSWIAVPVGEQTFVADATCRDVVIENVDLVPVGVSDVHAAVVGAEGQAVRHDDVIVQQLEVVLGAEPPQGTGRNALFVVHGAGEEPAGPVATTIVEAVVRMIRTGHGNPGTEGSSGAHAEHAGSHGRQERAILTQADAAGRLRQAVRATGAGCGAVHLQGGCPAVDPKEALRPFTPYRALAQNVGRLTNYIYLHRLALLEVPLMPRLRPSASDSRCAWTARSRSPRS